MVLKKLESREGQLLLENGISNKELIGIKEANTNENLKEAEAFTIVKLYRVLICLPNALFEIVNAFNIRSSHHMLNDQNEDVVRLMLMR